MCVLQEPTELSPGSRKPFLKKPGPRTVLAIPPELGTRMVLIWHLFLKRFRAQCSVRISEMRLGTLTSEWPLVAVKELK